MKTREVYIIYYTESSGRRYLVAITDNLEEWIKYNNSSREEGDEEYLEDFEIEEDVIITFNK